MQRLRITAVMFAGLFAIGLARPSPASAHCDSLDGPVVAAARTALETGDVMRVMPWVRAQDEPEIRDAFARTLLARTGGEPGRELADLWFFETVVRIHRAGEGEPYTGLKPVGWKPPEVISAADRALETGAVDELAEQVSDHVARVIHERHAQAVRLKDFAPDDIEAGRAFVAAYVAYTHLLEALSHTLSHSHAHEGAEPTTAHPAH